MPDKEPKYLTDRQKQKATQPPRGIIALHHPTHIGTLWTLDMNIG